MGYSVYMKQAGESDYEHIYNGTQNPATRLLAITEFRGAALQAGTGYDLLVRAYNWVGASPDTGMALATIINVRTSPERSRLIPSLDDAGWLTYSGADSATAVCIGGVLKAAVPELLGVRAFDADG